MKKFSNLFSADKQYVTGKIAWENLKKGKWKVIAFDEYLEKWEEEPTPHIFSKKSSWDWKISGYLWSHFCNKKWYEYV